MKNKIALSLVAAIGLLFLVAGKSSSGTKNKDSRMEVYRVELGGTKKAPDSTNLIFFIETGAISEPIVCLADNGGYPEIAGLYAHYMKFRGRNGVRVAVLFHQPPTGNGLSINLFQPGMTADFQVERLDEALPNARIVK